MKRKFIPAIKQFFFVLVLRTFLNAGPNLGGPKLKIFQFCPIQTLSAHTSTLSYNSKAFHGRDLFVFGPKSSVPRAWPFPTQANIPSQEHIEAIFVGKSG